MNNNTYPEKTVSNRAIINIPKLITQYYTLYPDSNNNNTHNIFFGTSGHRGSSQKYNFNEAHVLAISQSIVQVRALQGITGPCYLGKDTHALSEPAFISVLEVLAANSVDIIIQSNNDYVPTPVISHAIIQYNNNCNNNTKKADGIIVTSSHNPPEYGGIKYNSIFGGPAPAYITNIIERIANQLLINNLKNINRVTLNKAWKSGYIHTQDFVFNYIKKLIKIINIEAIKRSGLKLGINPLSGSSITCWQNIAQYYQLDLSLVNEKIDKTFSFMNLDYDGRIRIDCSSKSAMSGILKSHDNLDLLLVNDPDCDRHGIITHNGLFPSHHYLAIAINYLFNNRPLWNNHSLSIGKTCVSSMIINQLALQLNRYLLERPVGFKWFVKGLFNKHLGFAGEESAGASFLDYQCLPWSTDKDGFIMCLLAAEIIAISGISLQEQYTQLIQNCGIFSYNRIQIPITNAQKHLISNTSFNQINITELADAPIIKVLNINPLGNKVFMDNIKIITTNGWVACRLSGTESVYKIYCESFVDILHRKKIEKEIMNITDTMIHVS